MNRERETKYLEQLGKGNHRAFDALFMLYQPKVKNFLQGFIKDEEEARDMAQELFFKIWLNREQIVHIASFKAYLFRMARNLVYDYYEHNLVKESYEEKQKNAASYSDLIEEDLYAHELELLIDITVSQMPEQRRRIFQMSRKEGYTNQEIALQLEINKRTVENHLTQALADLRKVIQSTFLLLF